MMAKNTMAAVGLRPGELVWVERVVDVKDQKTVTVTLALPTKEEAE